MYVFTKYRFFHQQKKSRYHVYHIITQAGSLCTLIVVFMPKKIDEKPHLFPRECFHLASIWRCHFGVAVGEGRSPSPAPQHTPAGSGPLLPSLEAVMQKRG